MSVSPETLNALLLELESEDPLDFGELRLSEDEARKLVCIGMAQLSEELHATGLPPEDIETMALVVAARSVLENLALNFERLQRAGSAPDDAMQLLARLAKRR